MPTPNSLNLDYRLSYWPVLGLVLVLLVSLILLVSFYIEPLWRFGLLCALLMVFYWQLRRICHDAVDGICFDGRQWQLRRKGESLAFELGKETLVSPYLVVLVGRIHDEKIRRRWYFARDNCSEAEFRQLCRLLLMTQHENPAV